MPPGSNRPGERALAVVPLLAALGLAACGGPAFDGRVFRNEELSFRLAGTPSEWQPIEPEGALLAFRDEANGASIAVSGRCGKDGDDVPLEALTHHLFLQFTDRVVVSQAHLELAGRDALRTDLTAKLDGVEKRFTVFVLKKNGCVYDFLHVARVPGDETERARFVGFVEGFSTLAP